MTYQIYKSGKESYYQISKDYYKAASECTSTINWFNKLVSQKETGTHNNELGVVDLLERIEVQLLKDGLRNPHKFEERAKDILQKLNSSDGNVFEVGHLELGKLLGYISDNGSGDSDPDPWWIINDEMCIVCEDKIYQSETKAIPTKHVKQAKGHEDWIRKKIDILRADADITTVMLTNSNIIENSATTFADGIYYLNREEFVEWAFKAIEAIRKMRRSFSQAGDIVWRLEAEKIFNEYQVAPADFMEFIKRNRLVDLDVK